MAKISAIVPVCILAVSGCALFESSELPQEPAPAPPQFVVEEAPAADAPAQIETRPAPPSPPARSIAADDVRRVQMRLRDVGFDPGPIDGIAGAQTRIAFDKLAAGCAHLQKLPHDLLRPEFIRAPGNKKIPKREEVIRVQSDLRAAGFNPGPVDGIYGVRTRALVAQVPAACDTAREFGQGLRGSMAQRAAPPVAGAASAGAQVSAKRPEDAARTAEPAQAPPAREEIRVLQLRLRDAGFDPGPFDGIMGARTRAALAQYEASERSGKLKTSLTASRISGQY